MLPQNTDDSHLAELSARELWDATRDIHSQLAVSEIFGDDVWESQTGFLAMRRFQGDSGEQNLTFEWRTVVERILEFPKVKQALNEALESGLGYAERLKTVLEGFPAGVGEVYIAVDGAPADEPLVVDYKTAGRTLMPRNRLSQRPFSAS